MWSTIIKQDKILLGHQTVSKSLFEKSFWAKLFARKPSFFFKTRFLPQSRKAYTIQTHIIIIFSKPCQINDRDLVFKPDGLGESTATPNAVRSGLPNPQHLGTISCFLKQVLKCRRIRKNYFRWNRSRCSSLIRELCRLKDFFDSGICRIHCFSHWKPTRVNISIKRSATGMG